MSRITNWKEDGDMAPTRTGGAQRLYRQDIQTATPLIAAVLAMVVTVMAHSNMPTPLYYIYGRDFEVTTGAITVIYTMYAVGIAIGLVLVNTITARYGQRLTLVTAALVGVMSNVFFLAADSIGWLLAARILTGIACGFVMSVGTTFAVELTDASNRQKTAVAATACNVVGMGLGPVLGGIAADYASGPVAVVFTSHLVLLVVICACLVVLRKRDSSSRVQSSGWFRPPSADDFTPVFYGLSLVGLAGVGVFGLVAALTPAFLDDIGAGASFTVSGLVIACIFVGSAVAQFLLNSIRLRSGILAGSTCLVVGLILLALVVGVGEMWLYVLAALVSGVGQGMTLSRAVAAVSAAAQDASERVSAVSFFYFLVYLLASVPVILVGVVQRSAGLSTAATVFSVLSALTVLVGTVLATRRPV
jgi:predicted MFS family arabinose efflux permease